MSWFMLTDVRRPKPKKTGKKYRDGKNVVYEVRQWGVYPESLRKRWTTFQVFSDGTDAPVKAPGLVRPSFSEAQRALEAYAQRLALQEAEA